MQTQTTKQTAAAKPAPASKPVKAAAMQKSQNEGELIAVIRIKSEPMMSEKEERTLHILGLHNKYYCAVWANSPTIQGMLAKVQHLITWGPITEATLKTLKEKRGANNAFFKMHPPKGGFERKGIKVPFTLGGAYGNRKEKINELIMKMLYFVK